MEAGLVVSRARAADFVRRGCVTVAGEIVLKPAAMVAGDVALALSGDAGAYVSRGALKLDAALHAFGFDPKGCAVLDVISPCVTLPSRCPSSRPRWMP